MLCICKRSMSNSLIWKHIISECWQSPSQKQGDFRNAAVNIAAEWTKSHVHPSTQIHINACIQRTKCCETRRLLNWSNGTTGELCQADSTGSANTEEGHLIKWMRVCVFVFVAMTVGECWQCVRGQCAGLNWKTLSTLINTPCEHDCSVTLVPLYQTSVLGLLKYSQWGLGMLYSYLARLEIIFDTVLEAFSFWLQWRHDETVSHKVSRVAYPFTGSKTAGESKAL